MTYFVINKYFKIRSFKSLVSAAIAKAAKWLDSKIGTHYRKNKFPPNFLEMNNACF